MAAQRWSINPGIFNIMVGHSSQHIDPRGTLKIQILQLFDKTNRFKWLLVLLLLATPISAQSYYPLRLDDPKAVYLTPENSPVHGDGTTDDTEALQFAINKVQETTGEGIVFVPSGRYRLTATVYVWGGIRVIGFGPTRPVLMLGENTPGYTDKTQEKYMVFFLRLSPGHTTGRCT